MLRFLLWRLLGLLAAITAVALALWFLGGGPGVLLRGDRPRSHDGTLEAVAVAKTLSEAASVAWEWAPIAGIALVKVALLIAVALAACLAACRWRARRGRKYTRLQLDIHRTDHATPRVLAASTPTTST